MAQVSTLLCDVVQKEQNHNSRCGSLPNTHHALQQDFLQKQQPTTPTLFPFLSSSFSEKEKPQENNSVSPIRAVPIRQYKPPDSLCLHLSVGSPRCRSCSETTDDHPQPFKKRKPNRQQQSGHNKKAHVNDVVGLGKEFPFTENPTSLCLHLLLGSTSCSPTCFRDDDQIQTNKRKRVEQENNTKTKNADINDHWEIKKVLKGSDVSGNLSRLLLSSDLAMDFVIPVLGVGAVEAAQQKDGVQVQVWDVDKQSLHSLVFKIWPSAQSHVFTKTWNKDFVLRRELRQGDKVGLHWDQINRRFDFSVLNRFN